MYIAKPAAQKPSVFHNDLAKLNPKKLGFLNCRCNCIWHVYIIILKLEIGPRKTFLPINMRNDCSLVACPCFPFFCISFCRCWSCCIKRTFCRAYFGFLGYSKWLNVLFGDLEGQEFRFQTLLLSSGSLWPCSEEDLMEVVFEHIAILFALAWLNFQCFSKLQWSTDQALSSRWLLPPCGPDQV